LVVAVALGALVAGALALRLGSAPQTTSPAAMRSPAVAASPLAAALPPAAAPTSSPPGAPVPPGAPGRGAAYQHDLATLEVPPKLRLLVIAPHPDDESLAAGGLMQQVLEKGGRVHVLFMTSGDGYPEAVALATGHRQPTAVDYRGFGELRRAEALVALEHYHILPVSVTFLGFPDGGLQEIWRRGPHVPAYQSPYTHGDRPPYPEAFNPHAGYTSHELINQISHLVALADGEQLPSATPEPPDLSAFVASLSSAWRGGEVRPTFSIEAKPRYLRSLQHVVQRDVMPDAQGDSCGCHTVGCGDSAVCSH